MKNIVILISGSGSNMAAIVKTAQREGWRNKYGSQIVAVISNKADAEGLVFAQTHSIATEVLDHKEYTSREAFDAALMARIDSFDTPEQPALVVLAGFMRILTPGFVARYANRLLNIHPSLLPAFGRRLPVCRCHCAPGYRRAGPWPDSGAGGGACAAG
jgi:phosphoribosylglycinamide formyltransferase-1